MSSPLIDRRVIIAGFGALLLVPIHAAALQAGKVYRVGVLTELSRSSVFEEQVKTAMHRRGYVEGQNVVFEFRWGSERHESLAALAEELVRLEVDIIMTGATPPAIAAKRATRTIPIITVSGDPVGAGLVANLARPGGNVTGVFLPLADLAAKRLQLLREVVPDLTIVAIVWNPSNEAARSQFRATEIAAKALDIATHSVEMRRQADLDTVFRTIAATRARGFVVMQDTVTLVAAGSIAEFALKHRLPGSYAYRDFTDAGGLMSYGFNVLSTFEAAAAYAHKVLSGARPADLPMEQPSRLEVVINLKTAKALGLAIPPSLLLRADQVIE